jgi:hypothetical protein
VALGGGDGGSTGCGEQITPRRHLGQISDCRAGEADKTAANLKLLILAAQALKLKSKIIPGGSGHLTA